MYIKIPWLNFAIAQPVRFRMPFLYLKKLDLSNPLKFTNLRMRKENQEERMYHLHIPETNYLMVRRGLLEKDIPANVIGYVLLLKCLCINGTNSCYYTLKEIADKMNAGYSTLKGKNGLHQKAIDYGLIQSTKEKHTILDSNILLGESHNLPDSEMERVYVEQYKIIQSCCKNHHIQPPQYNKQLMRLITSRYVDLDLETALNHRLPKIKEESIFSLKYIIKLLNVNEKLADKEEEEYLFVM